MKSLKRNMYLLFTGAGLLIFLGGAAIIHLQLLSHVKVSYFDALSRIAVMAESDSATLSFAGEDYETVFANTLHRRLLGTLLIPFAASVVSMGLLAFAASHLALVPARKQRKRLVIEIGKHRREIESLKASRSLPLASGDAVLTDINHRIRTPLNAIIGLSSLMLQEKGSHGDLRENLEHINNSGHMLLSVIDSIHDRGNLGVTRPPPEFTDGTFAAGNQGRNNKVGRAKIPDIKALVVDDVRTNLKVAEGMMKSYGLQVDCAISGQEAVERIRKAEVSYNIIFMDYMMPEMNGIEATRIIRKEIDTEYAKTVPIIALTATDFRGKEDMFLQNGFNAIMAKPIDIKHLDKEINRWVNV